MSEVLRSVSEKDGTPAGGGSRPDYYEAWHEPAKTYDELEESLHSPNYHSAVRGLGSGAAVQRKKKKKGGAGKAVRTILLVVLCCAAGAFCGMTAAAGAMRHGTVYRSAERHSMPRLMIESPV